MNKWLPQLALTFWRRTAPLRSPVGLAILAGSFVGLRLLWIHMQRPANLEANAAAYGSIRDFYGAAQFNHDGSQFIFVATANDRGRAVFLCDSATGKKRQIIEDTHGVGIWNDDFDVQAGPWSPDDRYFLCVVSNRTMVCSAGANQEQVVIEDNPFSDAVWLTPNRFAYFTGETNLCVAQKRENGGWERNVLLTRNTPMSSLTAIGTDTVVWLEDSEAICRLNLAVVGTTPVSLSAQPPVETSALQPITNGLALWMDASRLEQPDHAPLPILPDLSRRKNDAVANGTPPIFNAANSPGALNGKGTIHFAWLDSATNGTGLKTLAPIGISGAAARSVFVVMRHNADRPMMVSMGDTSEHGALFAVEWSERLFLPTGWWADNYADATSTNWNLLEVIHDGAKQKGFLNGLLCCTASATLNTSERPVEIGYRDGPDAKAAEGDFAELLIYDRALNYAERKQVEDYLRGKWFGQTTTQSQTPVLWFTGLEGLTGLSYCAETGELLISCSENGNDSIWRMKETSGSEATPVQVRRGQSARNAQWAGPNRFVYASHLDTRNSLTLSDLSGNGNKALLDLWGNGSFDWFRTSPDQKQLFLYGNLSNAPMAGLWRCDLASATWHPIISVSDYPAVEAVTASHSTMFAPGGQVTCTIYRPANFDKHKKYPLVLGDTLIKDPIYGEPFMTGMAACGAIVAVVERPWWPVGIEQWAENVQAFYAQLKSDPTVDTRQAYLFAASAETYYLSQLMKTNSSPWRGLILLNPGVLPDFTELPRLQLRPKILLDAGGEEHDEDRFKKYQRDALNSGVVVEFYTHPGETHRMVGVDGKVARARELMRFIFEE